MAFIHEHIILPLSDLVTGQRVHHFLRFLRQSEHWSEDQIADFQNNRFRQLIQHASEHVPFYRDWLREHDLKASDFNTISDVVKLPIVDKAIIRKEGVFRFMADNVNSRQRMVSHSSGSTGEPFEFFVSRDAYSVNMAAKLRTWYDVGYRLGDSYVKLSSSPRESLVKRLQDKMTNGTVVTFNSLDDRALERILSAIEEKRPKIIRTHPNAIYYLARYRERHPEAFSFSPQYIMTTSSNLPLSFRDVITRVFGCDVIDAYSCEGTPNTAETMAHDGYHVTKEYGHIEVLDENNKPVLDGVGTVVSTDFWNYAMPFIRYNTRDLVFVDHDGVIQRIAGRACELLEMPNGRRFTGQVIEDFFIYHTNHSVEAFQVVKRHDGSVLFRLMVDGGFSEAIQQKIVDHWQNELGTMVEVSVVDHIPLMNNNKYLTIVNE